MTVNTPIFKVLFATFLLLSCSENNELSSYKIISDEYKRDIKRTVLVILPSRTNETNLIHISNEIYAQSEQDVQRTFINYRIDNYHKNQSYWATVQYDPTLEIITYGVYSKTYEKLKNTQLSNEKILGEWMSSWGPEHKKIAFYKDKQVYIQNIYSSGKDMSGPFTQSKIKQGIKLQNNSGESLGEYYIINDMGHLEFWSANGNYYTAQKL